MAGWPRQGSRRMASWKDPQGMVIQQRSPPFPWLLVALVYCVMFAGHCPPPFAPLSQNVVNLICARRTREAAVALLEGHLKQLSGLNGGPLAQAFAQIAQTESDCGR
jgi:hypothetical protein